MISLTGSRMQMNLLFCLTLGFGIGLYSQESVRADIFPPDRIVQWRGNVGVAGGIPVRETIRNCVQADGVPSDGVTVATAKIRTCLANTPVGSVAYLPAGTYKIDGSITIPANKTLRGAGPELTRIVNSAAGIASVLYIGAGYSNSALLPMSSGYTKGSTQITLNDATGIAVGNFLLLNELNDTSLPVTPASYADGDCTWCDQFGATRLRAQVVKVVGKSGNTLTLEQPLFFSFSSLRDPRAMKLNTLTEYAGVEDLTVANQGTSLTGFRTNIKFEGAANSWVRNVKVDTCGKRCIDLRTYYYRIEIRDSLITRCIDQANSDTCYGTQFAEGSSSLLENNIYENTANGPLLMWGASGNVISYNFLHSVFRTQQRDSWMWPNTWTHGAHPSFNLWEGNSGTALNWDGYWGSASHNIAFRNRFTSKDEAQGLQPGHVEVAAILVEDNNTYSSIVGNVLGLSGWSDKYEERGTRYWSSNLIYAISTPGPDDRPYATMLRHRNFDYLTNSVKSCGTAGETSCQGGDGGTVLPSSLYLDVRPKWFGASAFPPIGPEPGERANKLPAQICFEQGKMPNCLTGSADTTPPAAPQSLRVLDSF